MKESSFFQNAQRHLGIHCSCLESLPDGTGPTPTQVQVPGLANAWEGI